MNNKLYTYIPVILMGLIEGIIISLAINSFLKGEHLSDKSILKYTATIIIATASLLGLGAVFTRKEELSNTHDKRILNVYKGLDVDAAIKEDLIADALHESEAWKAEWEKEGAVTDSLSPTTYGITILFSYLIGGAFILANSIFNPVVGFYYYLAPFIFLAIFGFLKFRFTNRSGYVGLISIAVPGIAAGMGAYVVGTFM